MICRMVRLLVEDVVSSLFYREIPLAFALNANPPWQDMPSRFDDINSLEDSLHYEQQWRVADMFIPSGSHRLPYLFTMEDTKLPNPINVPQSWKEDSPARSYLAFVLEQRQACIEPTRADRSFRLFGGVSKSRKPQIVTAPHKCQQSTASALVEVQRLRECLFQHYVLQTRYTELPQISDSHEECAIVDQDNSDSWDPHVLFQPNHPRSIAYHERRKEEEKERERQRERKRRAH